MNAVVLAVTLWVAGDAASTDARPSQSPPASESNPTDSDFLEWLTSGTWLDPLDPDWQPRRGPRTEIAAFLGGEAPLLSLSGERLPSIGGSTLSVVARYYPVDRLAVVVGARTYLGVDGVPAAGTTTSSVLSIISGARYELVREHRFSLLWDLYSGPAFYAFADLASKAKAQLAVGAEAGSALAMRYSLGAFTVELRGFAGGRAGASGANSPVFDGPFSSLYSGGDLGVTWAM